MQGFLRAVLGHPETDMSACMRRKCKLYRFDNDSGEWKERGVGQVRLLQSQENGKIRLLMRQEKTLKIRANHFGEMISQRFVHDVRSCALSSQDVQLAALASTASLREDEMKQENSLKRMTLNLGEVGHKHDSDCITDET